MQGHAIPGDIYIERKRGHLGTTDSPRSSFGSRMLWGLNAPMEASSTSRKRSRASGWIRSIQPEKREKEISFSRVRHESQTTAHSLSSAECIIYAPSVTIRRGKTYGWNSPC
ncbi:hypothetical protein ACS0PU_010571 [Formica fusca]